MRKFVIKNRQKRKYTRKIEEISSFSFSKTAYGMIPLLIMLIAFMSTIIISTPFRDSISNINFNFTFKLPQFSFSNPLNSIQSLLNDFAQIGIFMSALLLAIYGVLMQSLSVLSTILTHEFSITQTNIITQKDASVNGASFIIQEFSKELNLLEQFIVSIGLYCEFTAKIVASSFINIFIIIGQIFVAIAISVAQIIVYVSITVAGFIISLVLSIFHFISIILVAIWRTIATIGNYLLVSITRIVMAIVHTIEIPFKILAAFGLALKPYVDIINHHIQMSGADFTNGVNDLGKAAASMKSVK
jgi:hypothetical protein